MRTHPPTLHPAAAFALACLLADCAVVPTETLPLREPDGIKQAVLELIANNYFRPVSLDTTLSSFAVMRTLDPFSYYQTRAQHAQSDDEMWDVAIRYGFGYECAAGRVILSNVVTGSAADLGGFLPGDEIQAIGGVSVRGKSDSLVGSLLPRNDRPIIFRIYRATTHKSLKITLRRGFCAQPSVRSFGMIDSITGYVEVTGFHHGTAKTLQVAVDKLIHHGMRMLVIDLRDNPGGFLSECLMAANLFVHSDRRVLQQNSVHARSCKSYELSEPARYPTLPLAVLVNGYSCSASEVFSGIMQDLSRAVIMGEPTIGKGLVMRYFELPNGDQLYLTVSNYTLPSGRCVQRAYQGDRYISPVVRSIESRENFDHALDPEIAEAECDLYRTMKGFPVLGGEGIIPDVIVSEPTYPLWMRDAINAAAMPYLQENADWLLSTTLDRFAAWSVPEEVTEAALAYARARDTSRLKLAVAGIAWEVPTYIKSYLAYAIWGDQGTFQIWTRNTSILRRARQVLWEDLKSVPANITAVN